MIGTDNTDATSSCQFCRLIAVRARRGPEIFTESNGLESKVDYNRNMAKPAGLAKTGGRRKGTPNKRTLCLEAALRNAGIDVVVELANTLAGTSPDVRARVLVDLLSYLYPKRKASEFPTDNSTDGYHEEQQARLGGV
jgi:hypothetical protein